VTRGATNAAPALPWLALAVCVLLVVQWLSFANVPFARAHGKADWIGAHNTRIADNYLRYGLRATGGRQILNLERAEPADWIEYQNHPATLDLLTAGVFSLFGGDDPWIARLLPLVASVVSCWLVWLLAGPGPGAWAALVVFAALPIFGAHGLNLSYEPLCLPFILAIVLLYSRGRRFSLLVLLFAGGLVDYPVLYLAPVLFVHSFLRRRETTLALPFCVGLVFASVAAFGAHIGHLLWANGDLLRDSGRPWYEFMLATVSAKQWMPGPLEFLSRQWEQALAGFTLPALVAAAVGWYTWKRRKPTIVEVALLTVGLVHVLVFRGHAYQHDFWLWYLAPVVALAVARAVQFVPGALGGFALVVIAILGLKGSLDVWRERALVPVRQIGRTFALAFDPVDVLHVYPGPGWAIENYRRHPCLELAHLLDPTRDLQVTIDSIGRRALLGRRQFAVVSEDAADDQIVRYIDRAFPGSRRPPRGSWRVWEITPFVRDPAKSPVLGQGLDPATAQRIRSRVRMHRVLDLLPIGARVAFVAEGSGLGALERFRRRWVRMVGPESLESLQDLDRWHVVAWPGTPGAEALEKLGGSAESLSLATAGGPLAIPWRPGR